MISGNFSIKTAVMLCSGLSHSTARVACPSQMQNWSLDHLRPDTPQTHSPHLLMIDGENQKLSLGVWGACGLCLRQGVESKLLEHCMA